MRELVVTIRIPALRRALLQHIVINLAAGLLHDQKRYFIESLYAAALASLVAGQLRLDLACAHAVAVGK